MAEHRRNKAKTMRHDYDVIVIGTGMGGSAAGAISALKGMKTLILEKNPRPGGACSYYEKDGFQVDTGTHLFIRGNKGPFGVLTKRLGLGTPIEFVHTKYTVYFKGMNVDVNIPRSPLAVLYEFVVPRLLWQTKISPIHYPAIARLFFDIMTMRPHQMEAVNHISVHDFMCRYTKNPEIRSMIASLLGLFFIVPPWEASAGESIWNLQKLALEYNLGYPKGGCVIIPKTFLNGAEKHGAALRLKAGVRRIDVEAGRAAGVTLESGDKITARAVISTTNLSDTVEKLTGPEYFTTDYVERVRAIKPSWTAVQAKIGLNKKLLKAGSLVGGVPLKLPGGITDENVRHFIHQLDTGEYPDMMPIYAPIPSNYDPALAPEGCQLITVVACAPTLDVELKQDAKVWIDGMMNTIREMVPGIDNHIMFCDTWSVQTLASWIGKSNGSAITSAQSPNQVSYMRPPHETPVKGLYMAGDCAGPAHGVGTELACQSGMDCADLVASHIYNGLL